jgi:hypothetical protein
MASQLRQQTNDIRSIKTAAQLWLFLMLLAMIAGVCGYLNSLWPEGPGNRAGFRAVGVL